MTTDRDHPVVEVIDDADLVHLAEEWDDLLAHSEAPTVFLTWAWVSSWRETLGSNQRLLIATARRPADGLLVGIAPMTVERRVDGRLLRYRALQFAGAGAAASDHLDLIIRTGYEQVAVPLWSAIIEIGEWDVFALDGLRPRSRLANLMSRQPGYKARYIEPTQCPVLTLPDSWEEYEASLGRNLRRNLRRYARKLDFDSTEPVIQHTVVSPEEVDRTIRKLASLHVKAHAAAGTESSFAGDDVVQFHLLVAARFLDLGILRLHRLDVGTSIAAIEYCFSYGDVVSYFQTGYDLRWSRYGPGRQIMAHSIRAAIEEGATYFDFLRGDEEYKQAWGAELAFDERIWMPASALGRVVIPARAVARKAARKLAKSGR
jgi:CelD/BcsL family acetyltransferase involved in cellulose biosynthesis